MHPTPSPESAGRPPRSTILILILMAGAIVVMGLRVITGPESRLAFLLYDDAFYYYKVAANLGAGLGSTFDGITLTNGYHPLWCWLLVPVFALVDSPGGALRLAAGLWFLVAAATAPALWWALRRRSGECGALLAAAFFALHPWLALHLRRPNGLETPLFALLVILTAGLFERSLAPRDHRAWNPARLVGLGAMLGLVILARVDGGFLAAAAAPLMFLQQRRRAGARRALHAVVLLTLGASVVAGPSLIWNTVRFASPVPISGRVVTAWQEPVRRELGAPLGRAFVRERVGMASHRLPRRLASYAVAETPLARLLWRSGRSGGMLLLLGSALLATAAVARRRRGGGDVPEDAVTLLVTFAILHGLAYAAWFWVGGEVIFRLYYFVPQSLAAAGVLGTLLGLAVERWLPRPGARQMVAAAVAVLMVGWVLWVSSSHLERVTAEPGPVAENHIYGWVKRHLPTDAVLAAIGSGRLGYFSGRPAVDLDCLISDPACLQAIRDDAMDRYVAGMPITHLVGGRATLKGFTVQQPEIPPQERDDLGEILYRLASRHGCRLKEVPGAPGTWAVIAIACHEEESPG